MRTYPYLWKVASQPQELIESSLISESLLEEMIAVAPRLLSDAWMLIGKQEDTGFSGRIDLLAIAPDGALVNNIRNHLATMSRRQHNRVHRIVV